MRLQLVHTIAVAAIASLAAWLGLAMLVPDGAEGWALRWTVAGSILIWLAFGNLYLHTERGIASAIYLGVLSPALGCLIVGPPWSLLIVLGSPLRSVGLGVATSLLVWAISRRLAASAYSS